MRPLDQFLNPINAVFIPALSRLQSQPQRYRSTFLRLYEAIALIGLFFTGLCVALAHPITIVLLGPKWEQASVIFAGFTIAALCLPLSNVAAWLFTSQGRGRDLFKTQLINACAIVLSFMAGLPFGPVGVAFAFSMSTLLVRLPIYYFNVGRRGPVSTSDLWHVFFRHLPVWLIVFSATWLTRALLVNLQPLPQLLICAVVGLVIGVVFILSVRSHRQVAAYLFRTFHHFVKPPLPSAAIA
jgi:polysaccharide transporter, PST family